jgi:hypothetical protein
MEVLAMILVVLAFCVMVCMWIFNNPQHEKIE